MIYEAVENILQRKQDPETEKTLSKYSSVIEEYENFGTHLMDWDIKKMTGEDDVLVPLLFLRNSIEIADAISVLINNSAIDPAKPVLRSLLENTLGLKYLFEKETDIRSLSYIVWNIHEEQKNLIAQQRVENIANTALFIVSGEARHITGQTLIVGGGWTSVSPSPY